MTDDRLTDRLRAATGDDWTAATDHRFARELHAGTLDDAVFRHYLVQDFAFVTTLADVVAHAAAQAPTLEAKADFAGFLGAVTTDETDYFRRAFDALAVPERDRTDPTLDPVTERFGDLLLRGALDGGYAETLAVLVPVEWVYLTWASGEGERPEQFYLAEWVDLHTGPAFEATVGFLRDELDALDGSLSPARERRLTRLFQRAVEYEVAFFDAAYERAAPVED
ncbi:TenA family protein [Halomarina ordinaria]|uniref:TenA family protein n=1 Tax=Halomarina ordinaria TaxID=3033939 RepID=A0ABD5U948_9EURY|nr:TenA family protein [Halomarina sp. PSRA2]